MLQDVDDDEAELTHQQHQQQQQQRHGSRPSTGATGLTPPGTASGAVGRPSALVHAGEGGTRRVERTRSKVAFSQVSFISASSRWGSGRWAGFLQGYCARKS